MIVFTIFICWFVFGVGWGMWKANKY